MSSFISICSVVLILFLDHGILGISARTSIERIQSAGYAGEMHNITTKDGYILTIFRLKNSTLDESGAKTQRPVVLLWHGLICSSDIWLFSRPEDALAFNLADSGYDVWLGNSRGTDYGNRHTSLSLRDPNFWRFTWHEIGVIDLPHTIDYILKETGQSSLHYVGHSQGTTIMFVLLSSQPAYNKKLKTSHLLAPAAFMSHARSPLLKILSPILGKYSPLGSLAADLSLPLVSLLPQLLGYDRCGRALAHDERCSSILFATFYGGKSVHFNKALMQEIFRNHPAGFSLHQMVHYSQLYISGLFRQYDLGVEGNRQRYGRSTPPNYNLANIKPNFPLHLYYSDFDVLTSKIDIEHLSRILGNNSVNHFIDLKLFAHFDFLFATNVKDVINRQILAKINKAELGLQYKSIKK